MNNFIVNTTIFLNDFSNNCEAKFAKVCSRISDLETTLMIFEAKLNSLPTNSGNEIISAQTSRTSQDTKKDQALIYPNDQIFSQHESDEGRVQKNALMSDSNSELSRPALGSLDQGNQIDKSMILNDSFNPSDRETVPRSPPPPPPLYPPSSTDRYSDVIRSSSETTIEFTEQSSGVKVKDHPDYAAFFKMMKVPSLYQN